MLFFVICCCCYTEDRNTLVLENLTRDSSNDKYKLTVINLPENTTIPAVIMFGDSIVDTGNNNYIKTIAKANYPPYGKDFMGGKPTGRFSDGKVPSDLLVEELGIKTLLPAYLDPSLRAQDLLTGVNFASGGAGYDPLTSDIASVLSLSDQLELFKDYITRLKKVAGEEKTSKILRESLIAVVTGSNDITNTYFGTPLRQSHYDVPSYTELLVSYASSFVQDLYRLGARRIGVFSLPPIGCLPSQRTLRGGLERKCVDEYNQVAQLFNKKLSAEMASINIHFPEARIVYIDIYNLPLDIIHNPQKYGFKIANKGCCGTGTVEVAFLCKYTCSNVSEYVFWDSFHPTEKTYRLLVHQVLKQYLNTATNLPENATIPAVLVFGDSIVDTGNNNNLKTITKANYLPYGIDFMGGKPTGRFSDGKSALSLSDQLQLLKNYTAKLKKIAGEERSATILRESLMAVLAGTNDFANTYFSTPLRQSHYDVPSYIKLVLSYVSSFVQDLYRLGARRIGVSGLPPIGCLPSQRTLKGGLERKCVDEYNQVAQLYNKKLSAELTSINERFPDAHIVYIDIYVYLLEIIHNPQKYGFKISDRGCCGTGTVEVLYLCKHACPNVSEYVFWDTFHPTEKAFRLLVHHVIEQDLNSFICGKSSC
ncbi:hypothetical protein Pfo_021465 [Paulownia fortunei]|nr:hypothetical protein Pfo_021465 [Paulownia fortunei]